MRRVFRGILLIILACQIKSVAWAQASDMPAPVQAAIEENRKTCEPEKVTLEDGFMKRQDINGDGVPDYILDYGSFTCGESRTFFCGTGGCVTQVFASLPKGGWVKVLDENVEELRFAQVKGKPAMILGVHGNACGKTGASACRQTFIWNGSTFKATK